VGGWPVNAPALTPALSVGSGRPCADIVIVGLVMLVIEVQHQACSHVAVAVSSSSKVRLTVSHSLALYMRVCIPLFNAHRTLNHFPSIVAPLQHLQVPLSLAIVAVDFNSERTLTRATATSSRAAAEPPLIRQDGPECGIT
jgi:hypothetical protein